jgi:hypothetical protein
MKTLGLLKVRHRTTPRPPSGDRQVETNSPIERAGHLAGKGFSKVLGEDRQAGPLTPTVSSSGTGTPAESGSPR